MRNHIKLADIYCRLSDEEKKHKNESESITNQRAIIRDYCEKHDIIIVKEFVDDGYSGGNFERPGFQAMLDHLSTGKANMVITKDLSRLGRNYIEAGSYIEIFFPKHHIRYIAITDGVDSAIHFYLFSLEIPGKNFTDFHRFFFAHSCYIFHIVRSFSSGAAGLI